MNDYLNKTLSKSEQIIESLGLQPHPEGGFYRRTFAAERRVDKQPGAIEKRHLMTSIYYLLTHSQPIGHFHCNASDIQHFFHGGSPITYYLISPEGELETVVLGMDVLAGEQPQLQVPGGYWKASKLTAGEFGLVGEAVAPGFDFADHILSDRYSMLKRFPDHAHIIEALSF